ncbi:N-acetyltransferase domain-containing protein [Candidatus Nitrotoga sp. HW29]|uniref:GNAT family N-acetyltransferase n=1 Tax=Candidatus Nitrotoga sp. HW29 TaxID=2886963 RepID=UPI001EF2D903|nr:GNAT family N-acetyltransferase [Candidatus Nitrotoga sp. HW29]CAH1906226.1 N-acetyltransferase domain-containing protein [Candidatus Nitrotoga sp. HW29]
MIITNTAPKKIAIRLAEIRDVLAITKFNQAMAFETEQKKLIPQVVLKGVTKILQNSNLGFYVIAERDEEIIGSLMVTEEWSDWRNGRFWWIQSVYIKPNERRKKIYTHLYNFVKESANNNPSICGFRLYVQNENILAKNTYEALGMIETNYRIYEELKPATHK